ncbi:3-isopropylmalate dehydratase small subunit [Kordiimonas sediminis]|uniref:3-isopropylmalate dehydratase small subunit n=1 Tax=Kordiimonas sediminis TaxID=1735581 RepID=A0A919APZ1_9PROT|nr:3-isopropylmalate dehydratase small subunit [Kordiimonas sediminis]GHF19825.1 3-isopropylmalate dehydratase small subunit [Kordiimonas sediminis]
MEKFTHMTSTAIALEQSNIDTDIIMPSDYLKTIKRTGLGKHAFESLRYTKDGTLRNDSPFDFGAGKTSKILVVGDNFGCGSSREHAPWGIADLGIRCLIGTSFADIFASNCVKNGILTITLPEEDVAALMRDAKAGKKITVDLEAQTVSVDGSDDRGFEYNPQHKYMMVNGLDEIGQTLLVEDKITAFEEQQRLQSPWLYRELPQ